MEKLPATCSCARIRHLATLARVMTDLSNADSLADALARHQIALQPEQQAAIERYCRMLWQKNQHLNLTRHTDYEKFVSRDLVDAQAIASQLEPGETVLDVGTGGGVPGILLAILRPDLHVQLCESVGKKARAVEEFVRELGLNIPVHAERAESVLGQRSFDTLVARAVAPLPKLLRWLRPYWSSFGRLLVVKGPAWLEERREARRLHLLDGFRLRRRASWPLPGSHNQSVLLEISPETEE